MTIEPCSGGAASTVTGAVGPVGDTETPSPWALALLKYVSGSSAAVAENESVIWPFAGTVNGPSHVSDCPSMSGSFSETPDVESDTYAKPSGSVSEIDVSSADELPSFVIVIV